MRLVTIVSIAAGALLVVSASQAHAANCTVNQFSYCCDFSCTGGGCPNPVTFAACDAGTGDINCKNDGLCVICGTSGGETINGTPGDDVLCGKGGADTIDGGDGGDDIVDGGAGDDEIDTGDGDDVIFGGGGDDVIVSEGGRDYLSGGAGDDVVATLAGNDDVLGALLCGGKGDDLMFGVGYGHQCIDAGPDQTGNPTGLGFDCAYGEPASPDDHDVGTVRNCHTVCTTGDCDTPLSGAPPCGCDN